MTGPTRVVEVGGIRIGGGGPLALIAGPCVLEDRGLVLEVADEVRAIARRLDLPVVFKSSYMKDNRSSAENYRGPGTEKGLALLAEVRERTGMPILSDVHWPEQVEAAARVLDVLQIPAYLSQQTELVQAAARTGKVVNVKKGQFVAPEDMAAVVGKVESAGSHRLLLTERGSSFGYRRLVCDYRSLAILAGLGYPVVFDATHIVRLYGTPSRDPLGGERAFIPLLCRAAAGAGVDAFFLETHPDPPRALCDAASQWPLSRLEGLLREILAIDRARRESESHSRGSQSESRSGGERR